MTWINLTITALLIAACVLTAVDGRPASRIGHSVPRIIGGTPVTDGQFPWTLSVEYYGSLGWLHMCGGILIKPNYALTGAKCVNNVNVINLRAWAGILYRDNKPATNAQQLSINQVTIHPEYNEYLPGIPNDLAILRFAWPANTTQSNIAVASLPANSGQEYNGDCYISGWGRYNESNTLSNEMLYVTIPVITNQQCADSVATISQADILPTHVCVMSEPPGQGACNGDSGGPLMCHENNDPDGPLHVAGACSWTVTVEGNCNPYYPSVYSRLSEYIDWIDANTP